MSREDPYAPQLGLSFEGPRDSRRIWPVRELVSQVRELIEQEYGDVWVEGESQITALRRAATFISR